MKRIILAAGFLLGSLCPLRAEALAPTEYEIKAAFLYNFAKFVEWPAEALQKNPQSFVIGILGEDPFGSELDRQLAGKKVKDLPLVLRRISTVQEASSCQVLFIGASSRSELDRILASIRGLPVLTVSDMDRFAQHGGMVGFSMEDNKVRFSINKGAADKAELKVSSQLLKLAKTIISCLPAITPYVWIPSRIIPFAVS